MTVAVLFFSTMALVFLLGLQSLTINAGHRIAAMVNSTMIGCANLVVLKLAPDAGGMEMVAYVVGGPVGIVGSMMFFRWYRKKKEA